MPRYVYVSMIAGVFCVLMASQGYSATTEHPVVKLFPKTKSCTQTTVKDYDAYQFYVMEGKKWTTRDVKGKHWIFHYCALDKSISGLEVFENYKAAVAEKQGAILYEDNQYLTFTIPTPQGVTWGSLQVHAPGNNDTIYWLHLVDEKGFKKTLTFGADEMKKELDDRGSVAVYGITFAFDKASLQPGAEKVLLEMVKLMTDNPGLKIEIQGHTDKVGGDDYNLTLSQKRAETVRTFLVLYGVDPARLTCKGFGFRKPVAANDTEEGKAKNRRVELHKLH